MLLICEMLALSLAARVFYRIKERTVHRHAKLSSDTAATVDSSSVCRRTDADDTLRGADSGDSDDPTAVEAFDGVRQDESEEEAADPTVRHLQFLKQASDGMLVNFDEAQKNAYVTILSMASIEEIVGAINSLRTVNTEQ